MPFSIKVTNARNGRRSMVGISDVTYIQQTSAGDPTKVVMNGRLENVLVTESIEDLVILGQGELVWVSTLESSRILVPKGGPARIFEDTDTGYGTLLFDVNSTLNTTIDYDTLLSSFAPIPNVAADVILPLGVWGLLSAVTATDPGAGSIKLNVFPPNGTEISIYLNALNKDNQNLGFLVDRLVAGDEILIASQADPDNNVRATVVSVVDNTGWYTITITSVATGTLAAEDVFLWGTYKS